MRRVKRTRDLRDLARERAKTAADSTAAIRNPNFQHMMRRGYVDRLKANEALDDYSAKAKRLHRLAAHLDKSLGLREGILRYAREQRRATTRKARRARNVAIWTTPLTALAAGYPLAQYEGMKTHAKYEEPIMMRQASIQSDKALMPITRKRGM